MWVVGSSLIQWRKNRCRMECHIDNDSSKDFIYVLSYKNVAATGLDYVIGGQ